MCEVLRLFEDVCVSSVVLRVVLSCFEVVWNVALRVVLSVVLRLF